MTNKSEVIKLFNKYESKDLDFHRIKYGFSLSEMSTDSNNALVIVHSNNDFYKIPSLKLITTFSKEMQVPLVSIPGGYGDKYEDNISSYLININDIQEELKSLANLYSMKYVIFIEYDVKTNEYKFFTDENAESACHYILDALIEEARKKAEIERFESLSKEIKDLNEDDRAKLLAKLISNKK